MGSCSLRHDMQSRPNLMADAGGCDAGAPGETRTPDPLITNQVLYQLSYKGMPARK